MSKATDRFLSGKHPEEIETYGEVMDDVVMNSPIGPTINDYQTAMAKLHQTQFELIQMCYESLDNAGKKKLCDYACQLLEGSDEFKEAVEKYGIPSQPNKPPTTE